MPLTKDEMRKNIKALIANGAITREISQAVCQNILSLNEFNEAKTVMGFMPKNDEIDITFVFDAILQSGKTLFLPKCEENGEMTAFAVANLEVLQKGAFGILEPPDFLEKAEKKNIEICLVPCVACDEKGNRLGRGKGYYDRFLKDTAFTKILVCGEFALQKYIKTEPFDEKCDIIVTEKRIIRL